MFFFFLPNLVSVPQTGLTDHKTLFQLQAITMLPVV